jgi:HD-GYP domain-containing protein (c-di-GMP phosphodiesterase class II)
MKWSVAALACTGLGLAATRFYQSYRLTMLPLQGSLAFGLALLIEAQVFMTLGVHPRLSWWAYHVVMLLGFAVCVVGLLRQYRITGDLGVVVEGLFLRVQVSRLRAGDPQALTALGAALAAKDTETDEHLARVADLAVALGRRLGLAEERLEALRWTARLHDVGKIGVPNSILRKPGPLTAEEFEVMKVHTIRGWRIAERSGVLAVAAPMIRAHHERMDGTGYPDGLRGEEIPIEARIVAAADVWDALTCDRPYREALLPADARAIVEEMSGHHLDPVCVEALLAELQVARGTSAAARPAPRGHMAVA